MDKAKPPQVGPKRPGYTSFRRRLARMYSWRREFPGVATVHTTDRLRALSSSSSDSGLGQSKKRSLIEMVFDLLISPKLYLSRWLLI